VAERLAAITSFRDLEAWQLAVELAVQCYRVTCSLPTSELFGLVGQIRRASVSVPSNIAEGHRKSRAGFRSHLRIAAGSLAELETQLELAKRTGLISDGHAEELVARAKVVGRLLNGLLRALGHATVGGAGVPSPGRRSPTPAGRA
jgi:four helix bundle protein